MHTYFGEGFYRDALPVAHDLREAFEITSREITKRERAEKRVPSEPQAFFGSAIEAKLAAMAGVVSGGESRDNFRPPSPD